MSPLLQCIADGARRAAGRILPRQAVCWPTLEQEVGEWRRYLTGRCLNAGAGVRDASALVSGELVNVDIRDDLPPGAVHLRAPLHDLPVPDGHFDSILCNAVLEHVDDPDAVLREFCRVLAPGGHLYLCVPFLQPYHPGPVDHQRYTLEGLCHRVRMHGFRVLAAEPVHTVYHTLGWILQEWLNNERGLRAALLRALLYPVLRHRTRRSRRTCAAIASAVRLVAVKDRPGTAGEAAAFRKGAPGDGG